MSTVKTTHELTLSLTVTSRAKSAIWYETHFGFKQLLSIDEAGWTEMSTNVPGVTLGLGDAEDHAPGNCVPVFGVTDIDASRSALEAAAVKFDGDTVEIEGMVKLATLYDPDNNALMIAQNLS